MQRTQILSNNEWIEQNEDIQYSYNRILFNHKKEWATDIHDNVDEPSKYYGKWKQSDTKDDIYCRFPFVLNAQSRQVRVDD
jgi:hypothetical protein